MRLPTDEKALKEYVKELLRRNETNKLARTAMTQLSENQVDGIQWYRFSRQLGYIYRDDEVMAGMILNYLRYVLDLAHASLTANSFSPECYSVTNTPALNRAAQVGTTVLRDVYLRNGGAARQKFVAKTAMIRGSHFVRPEIDETALDSLILSPDRMQQFVNMSGMQPLNIEPISEREVRGLFRLGHVAERDISCNNVVVPNGVESFKDTPWFSVTHYMPVEQVQKFCEEKGADPEQVKAARIRDLRALNMSEEFPIIQGSYSFESREDSTESNLLSERSNVGVLTEFWNREDDGSWTCLYFANIDRDYYVGGEGGYTDHNYVMYSCWNRPGRFWPAPYTTDLIQIQRTINKVASVQLRHFIKSAKDMLFLPKGARILSIGAKEGTNIVEYSPLSGHAPQFVSVGSSIMEQLSALLGKYEGLMLQFGKVSSSMQGEVPDRISEGALGMAYSQNNRTLGELSENFQQSEREKWKKELELVRNSPNFNLPRIATMLGSDGRPLAMEWKNTDLSAHLLLQAKPSAEMPETVMERTARATELWAQGFFQPGLEGARDMFNQSVGTGKTQAPNDDMQKYAEMQAIEENQLIQIGQIAIVPIVQVTGPQEDKSMNKISIMVNSQTGKPLVQPWQNHVVHLEVLDELIQNPSTPDPIRQMAVFHQAEHQRELQAAEAMQQQAAMNSLSQESIANAAGPMLTTAISANAKPKSSPSAGGKKSGQTRRK